MKCERAREFINGEYDEALVTADREALEAHVMGCSACREFRAQMDAVVAGLDDLRSLTDVAINREPALVKVPWIRHLTSTPAHRSRVGDVRCRRLDRHVTGREGAGASSG